MTTAELTKEIGEELVRKLPSMRDDNPSIWTPAMEQYINTTLKKTGNDFRWAVLDHVSDTGNELFKSYCEKVLLDFFHLFDVHSAMPRNIGKRKYIIYLVASLFKFYETTFAYLYFDWIESFARAAKMIKSSTFSGIVRVDAKATRHSDGLDIWHMEVAGPSENASDDHIINDVKKALHTDLLNLVAILRNHLNCDVNIAMKIKVFCTQAISEYIVYATTELASIVIPFSFNGRSQYKSILRMMAIFHEEIEKQEILIEEINCYVAIMAYNDLKEK
ncbi:8754_t:CDS:2 [Funneliformis geosporum]|uniref:8754_t:CDS:1 n=1 Tax=Funneliformis geosporum TaxID=1117311 RepID=A0A9W4SUV8_9GLOM|nr:8754_t:CDS:2 [Funneliformis geosporum]